MFRIWIKEWKNNHMLKDMVYESEEDINRTKKIFAGIEKACNEWDLSVPIWLDVNVRDFKKHARCRFTQDSFIESLDFDYLEIQVIEEDW